MKAFNGLAMALVVCALAGIGALGCNTIQSAASNGEDADSGIQNAPANAQKENMHPGPHTITASAKRGGSITPAGSTSVSRGATQTYIATANTGYRVADLRVDGRSVGAFADLFHDDSTSYTFNNITANHVISASFDLNKRPLRNGRRSPRESSSVSSLMP